MRSEAMKRFRLEVGERELLREQIRKYDFSECQTSLCQTEVS